MKTLVSILEEVMEIMGISPSTQLNTMEMESTFHMQTITISTTTQFGGTICELIAKCESPVVHIKCSDSHLIFSEDLAGFYSVDMTFKCRTQVDSRLSHFDVINKTGWSVSLSHACQFLEGTQPQPQHRLHPHSSGAPPRIFQVGVGTRE